MRLVSRSPHSEVELLVQLFQVPAHQVAHLHILQMIPAFFVPGVGLPIATEKKSDCCAGAGPRSAVTHIGTTSPAMRGAAPRLPPLAAAPGTDTGVVDFEPGVFPDRWWFADTLGWHAGVASDERPRGTRGYSTWLGDGWDESPSRIP